jgi:hypothetical protein
MTNPLTVPPPDYARLRRADEPNSRGQVPGFSTPTESANVLLNKTIATLNRAGSNPGNPVLSGLGVTLQYALSRGERLTGLFLYKDPGDVAANQIASASLNALTLTYNFRAGSGLSKAGSPVTGAVRNVVRVSTSTGRGTEKEYWVKSYDADVVSIEGVAALDVSTLLPVAVPVQIVDGSRPWLDVRVDFMASWNDEFQVLHVETALDQESGFRKAYGGAAFVSFFDTTPGTEGVGTAVNPVTQDFIYQRRSIQIENVAGTYQITARFRSKKDSFYFVDVPLIITVLAAPSGSCLPPIDEPCGSMLLLRGTALPANVQSSASVPGVQDVAGTPGGLTDRDLFYCSIHEAAVGANPTFLVRKWKIIVNGANQGGFELAQVGTDLTYLPLRTTAASPTPGGSYGAPQMLTVCFDVLAERALLVAFYTISVKDGDNQSPARPFVGPRARDINLIPVGGTGGTDPCVIY